MKGNYTRYPAIKAAQYRRLDAIKNPLWVEAMATKIKRQKWFRWHDAGDLQSVEHMNKIIEVCKLTPDTQHWLPTQERQYLPKPEDVPANLIIRLSAAKVDGTAGNAWSHSSTVVTDGAPSCRAPDQGGKCLDCRACWDKDVKNVSVWKTLIYISWSMHALTMAQGGPTREAASSGLKLSPQAFKLDRPQALGYCRSHENIYNHRASIHLEARVPCYAWEMGN